MKADFLYQMVKFSGLARPLVTMEVPVYSPGKRSVIRGSESTFCIVFLGFQ